MKLPRRNFLHLVAGAAAVLAVSRFAWAQAYPTRPVRVHPLRPRQSGQDQHGFGRHREPHPMCQASCSR